MRLGGLGKSEYSIGGIGSHGGFFGRQPLCLAGSIADLVVLTPDRFHVDRNEHFDGAPTVVVEIQSPGDEAREKLPFYAAIGTPEVWIIDRDSKSAEVLILKDDGYVQRSPGEDRWLRSPATGIELQPKPTGKLAIRIAGQPETTARLPED